VDERDELPLWARHLVPICSGYTLTSISAVPVPTTAGVSASMAAVLSSLPRPIVNVKPWPV
jgi:hypothetical protein